MTDPSNPSMLPRFEGVDKERLLTEELKRQALIGEETIAARLAQKATLIEVLPGIPDSTFIIQGDVDNDIYFILSGTVSVEINGRVMNTRCAGTHVGEISLIDRCARRSATVTAIEPCLFARVTEKDFSEIANEYPILWRRIAVEVANRLLERNKSIKKRHNQPVVFIGSSSEQLDISQEIQLGLSHDRMVVSVWTDNIFLPSSTPIEDLLRSVNESDFAILVISPDDRTESRGVELNSPRDNVLFELGLFMGGINRDRTFIVKPRGVDIKIPTDLLGLKPIEYSQGEKETLTARIAPVCTELRRIILHTGPK